MSVGVTDKQDLKAYFEEARSWDQERLSVALKSRRLAWIIATVAGILAIAAVTAVALLTPLKTVQPYVIAVDRATGATEITAELTGDNAVLYDEAVAKYFLAQYVRLREGWVPRASREFFNSVALMSAPAEEQRWARFYRAANPESPQNIYDDFTAVGVAVRSITFINKETAQVRFTKDQVRGATSRETEWIAIITYGFSSAPMREGDRFRNPLGFQVLSYRADPEVVQ